VFFHIPEELYECAQLDGCNDFMFFFRIVIPLSATALAVLTLFYAIRYWNSFFQAFVYLSDGKLYPLQLVLREILVKAQSIDIIDSGILSPEEVAKNANMAELVKYCIIVVASAPIVCFYPFIQRYFVKGVMMGSIKG
jgi:ABC-type glycerol-3-phosphate transport system permease component